MLSEKIDNVFLRKKNMTTFDRIGNTPFPNPRSAHDSFICTGIGKVELKREVPQI